MTTVYATIPWDQPAADGSSYPVGALQVAASRTLLLSPDHKAGLGKVWVTTLPTGLHLAATLRGNQDGADLAQQLRAGHDVYVTPITNRGRLLAFAASILETWPSARLTPNPLPPAPVIDTSPVRLVR